ncbi:MAG: glycosyltransferase family 39 protein, partial [Methylococcales bacterium]|nr:glycosyltransferase family 39 protein [Methylococcales bacterium]
MTASLFPASHRTKLILILLIGMTLRFSFLGSKSLWFDEAFTAVYSLNPIPTLLLRGGERPETHPPLYYIGIHYWIQAAGDSETALRLPSALASTVSLVLLYLLGRRLFNPKIGLMAMALLAVAPIDIWYAQEARMYAFMATFGLLMALALLWERWWAIGLLTITLTLGIYFNYVMFPIWAGLSGLWLAYWWKDGKHLQPIITWAVASVLAWLLYIPWLPKLIETLVISNRVQLFIDLRNKLHFPYLSPEQYLWLLPLAGLIIWLGATLFLHLLRHQTNKKGVYWIILSAFLILTLLSPLPRLYSIKRVLFAPSWPFFALLAAWVIHHLQVRQRQIWRGVILLSFLASLVGFAVPKDDWRG